MTRFSNQKFTRVENVVMDVGREELIGVAL
jgi:hypothetical protein